MQNGGNDKGHKSDYQGPPVNGRITDNRGSAVDTVQFLEGKPV